MSDVVLSARSWSDLPNWPLSSWLLFLIAMVALIVLIWAVIRLVARVNEDTDPAEADREMLLALSELHQEGDLTQEEYRSIKSQLAGRLRAPDQRFSERGNAANSACPGNARTRRSADRSGPLDTESETSESRDQDFQSGDSADRDSLR